MRSDDPGLKAVLVALAEPIAELRAMLDAALAREERAFETVSTAGRSARARAELGAFGEDRIDAAGFARLCSSQHRASTSPATAAPALRDALHQGEDLFGGEVPPGGDVGTVLAATLSRLRKLFTAAGYHRQPVLPLVIEIDGADLHAGSIAEFCDARVKLVLVVRGPCAPAPLARLITPGNLVLQTSTPAALDRVVTFRGPAIAALVPKEAAQFLHDPEAGSEPWQRIRVENFPEPPRRALGRITAWQQTEELRHLAALAQAPVSSGSHAAAEPNPPPSDAELTDRLTAWLLVPERAS